MIETLRAICQERRSHTPTHLHDELWQTIDNLSHPLTQQFGMTICLPINKLLKTSRPGKYITHLTLQAYPADEQLCIFTTLPIYLAKTKSLRQNQTELLIVEVNSYQGLHKPVTTDTIARRLTSRINQNRIRELSVTYLEVEV